MDKELLKVLYEFEILLIEYASLCEYKALQAKYELDQLRNERSS